MSFSFTKNILKICVGQICQNIGWQAIQTSPMDILIDILHRYILEIAKSVHRYSNQYGRIEPNLDDVGLAFKDLGILLQEIEEYVINVEPVPFPHKLPALPVARSSQFRYSKPGSREILHRPEYIPEYLPPMHPELEEEEGTLSPTFEGGLKKISMDSTNNHGGGESSSPLSSPKHSTKRSADWSNDAAVSKKPRHYTEEEGRPMHEVMSFFMTSTGLVSPVREPAAADKSLPSIIDSPPSTPEPPSHAFESSSKKELKSKESKKDKSSKSKREKELSKKDLKKNKSSKKENKENTEMTGEKSGTPSFSSKKEHTGSHKSSGRNEKASKSSDSSRKSRSDKGKFKESKEEHRKFKDSLKLSKSKSKLKHGSSKSVKSSRLSKSPQKYSGSKSPQKYPSAKSPQKYSGAKSPHKYPVIKQKKMLPKSSKSSKKNADRDSLSPIIKRESPIEPVFPKFEVKEEPQEIEVQEVADFPESFSREESPEPRLVIDDSIETQVRQEKESRLAVMDECISAVIQRGQEESEMESEKAQRSIDDVINEVAHGPGVRKLEAKDIYDFTDSSDLSSMSPLEPENSPPSTPVKKEKSKTPEIAEKISENPKKRRGRKKEKKETKPKSPSNITPPKSRKSNSPNVIVKREERSPSPIRLKDEIYSSDGSLSSRSPSPLSPENIFDLPPSKHSSSLHPPPPFVPSSSPSSSYSASPFAPIPPLPGHIQSNPHFPTPPLFVTSKAESSTFNPSVPLNLAKTGSTRSPSDDRFSDSHVSARSDDSMDSEKIKSENIFDKVKSRNHRKERKDKNRLEKREKLKKKNKDKKEKDKQKVKTESAKEKPKDKGKQKTVAKEEKKGRNKLEKDKRKDKERETEKGQEDAVPKFTLKLASASSGSGKFFIKPSKYDDSSPPASPVIKERSRSPSMPSPRAVTPSPPPHAASPSPAPSPIPPEPIEPLPVALPPPITKTTHSRGRGRGRKPAAQPAVPQARTVITETLGSIVDESGNKIWICPACTRPDDGSPMIGCDECDDWYHWVCVHIIVPPKEEESWYCTRCISKRQTVPVKRRRRKHKKDK